MASQPAQHYRNSLDSKFRWPVSYPNTAGIQYVLNSGGQPANTTLLEFNICSILVASHQHCRNPVNVEFRWPAGQPNTAGIQSILNSGGQSANPTLLEFNKFEFRQPASQPNTVGIQKSLNSGGQPVSPTLQGFSKF